MFGQLPMKVADAAECGSLRALSTTLETHASATREISCVGLWVGDKCPSGPRAGLFRIVQNTVTAPEKSLGLRPFDISIADSRSFKDPFEEAESIFEGNEFDD